MNDNKKEEFNALIAGLHSKLPDNVTVEMIDFDEQPGRALPPELLAKISQAAEALAKNIFGDAAVVEMSQQVTQISPTNGGAKSKCYHYILDNNQPVHCEDDQETHRFQQANKDILATQVIDCIGIAMRLTTRLVVHNTVNGDEIPRARWVTELFREYTAELVSREESYSINEAWAEHRKTCKEIEQAVAKETEKDEDGNE